MNSITRSIFCRPVLIGILGFAQAHAYAAVPDERPVIQGGELASIPTLDGAVIGDPAWAKLSPASGFRQIQPDDGLPATQRTEVYVGFREDAGGALGSGSSGFNLNWDGSWDVAADVSDIGWSAEMRIPFRTLRYGRGDARTWGINFQRNIRRNNEIVFWAPLSRQHDLYRVSDAGSVIGISPPSQRNLKISPYVLGKSARGGDLAGTEDNSEFGFDVKYSITPSLTLDATYNTDFAQVEADEQQVNLDRFSLFFKEKRPFFLENAGQSAVGDPEAVEMIFRRRTRQQIYCGENQSGIAKPLGYRLYVCRS